MWTEQILSATEFNNAEHPSSFPAHPGCPFEKDFLEDQSTPLGLIALSH